MIIDVYVDVEDNVVYTLFHIIGLPRMIMHWFLLSAYLHNDKDNDASFLNTPLTLKFINPEPVSQNFG